MKVKCRIRASDRRSERDDSPIKTRIWKETLPFNVNPRGTLIHRVRAGKTHSHFDGDSHDSVDYWCGNSAVGDGVDLRELPPKDRLLCIYCERKATDAGEPPAEKIAGRHVCLGVMKPVRLCCHNKQN